MQKVVGMIFIFMAGGECERLLTGDVENFFGTRWLLWVFFISLLFAGVRLIVWPFKGGE